MALAPMRAAAMVQADRLDAVEIARVRHAAILVDRDMDAVAHIIGAEPDIVALYPAIFQGEHQRKLTARDEGTDLAQRLGAAIRRNGPLHFVEAHLADRCEAGVARIDLRAGRGKGRAGAADGRAE